MDPQTEMLYQIALTRIPQVGAVIARHLISYCGSLEGVFQARKRLLMKIPGVGEKIATAICQPGALREAEEEVEILVKRQIKTLFYLDQNYPRRLKPFPESPILLYYKGECDFNASRMISIVGTRKPSDYGRATCEKIIEDLRPFGVTIISGLAYGIDITAHKSCISNAIPTIGVLGSGLGRIYPSIHLKTVEKMMLNGGVVTEFTYHTKPDKENFPARNRIVAALSDATLVIESNEKGGSMITAAFANGFHKDVFALPGRASDPTAAGCNNLIKYHQAQLIETGEDIARFLNWEEEANHEAKQIPLFSDLSEPERLILELLGDRSPRGIEFLSFHARMKNSELSAVLLSLEFKGAIRSLPGNRYSLN